MWLRSSFCAMSRTVRMVAALLPWSAQKGGAFWWHPCDCLMSPLWLRTRRGATICAETVSVPRVVEPDDRPRPGKGTGDRGRAEHDPRGGGPPGTRTVALQECNDEGHEDHVARPEKAAGDEDRSEVLGGPAPVGDRPRRWPGSGQSDRSRESSWILRAARRSSSPVSSLERARLGDLHRDESSCWHDRTSGDQSRSRRARKQA